MFGFYTRFFRSQVENTLSFALILRADFEESVEKFCICLWKTLWKTRKVTLFCDLSFRQISFLKKTDCVKLKN